MKVKIFAKIKLKVDFRMKLKPKKDNLLFVIIIILSYENMITTNNKISYFGFDFKSEIYL